MRSERRENNINYITLPDGYNGHRAKFYIEPLEVDGNLLKLRCAEEDQEYMFRWCRKEDYNRALKEA